jgi:hypothetical protein
VIKQEAVLPGRIEVESHDLARVVYPATLGIRRTGPVEGRVAALVEQEAVLNVSLSCAGF